MTQLAILRGLPASGKTTLARQWVKTEPDKRARLNRDDLRASMFNGAGILDRVQEDAITKAQHAQATALLKAGTSVIVDDTNLRLKYANAWATLADDLGVNFHVIEVDTPVDVCVLRDHARKDDHERHVGEDTIRRLDRQFRQRLPIHAVAKTTVEVEQYKPDLSKPCAYIVDIDGTLALMAGRGPYDTHRYHEDTVNKNIADLVAVIHNTGCRIILCSGRDATYRPETEKWLKDVGIAPYTDFLLMRPAGDNRNDAIIKRELFDEHIRHHYNVRGVLDDRNRVVDMWRSLGLTCLQVAPGDF